jgi:hypothetical protein
VDRPAGGCGHLESRRQRIALSWPMKFIRMDSSYMRAINPPGASGTRATA